VGDRALRVAASRREHARRPARALGDRDVVIARELTKRFETITRAASSAAALGRADDDRGAANSCS
jgi:16S rRNA C1402 (ribose-2'-O) methylase RsmI